ncbi:MAG: hypothetical protein M1819_001542 [Sarea resinae]|nr:MAG: hypothetical protein M1819_001542 [Sarea resinae]
MTQHAAELCTLLIDDIYGELSSRVFSTLLRFGRLPLHTLIKQSRLPARLLKHGLAVLIQQHLVLHYTSPEDEATYYEADWKSAYALVRAGKMIKLAEDRFGEAAGGVVSNLHLLGHARVGDLAAAYGVAGGKRKGTVNGEAYHLNGQGLPNGTSKEQESSKGLTQITTRGQLHSTIHVLLQAGYVSQVRDEVFRPPADNRLEAERVVRRDQFNGELKSGAKEKDSFERAVIKKLKQWRDGEEMSTKAGSMAKGVKRSHGSSVGNGSKRAKLDFGYANGLNGHDANDEDEDAILLDDDLVVRVNHEKCTVALRNQQLVDLVQRYIGETTAQVYAELLRRMESKIPRCRDDLASDLVDDEDDELSPTITTLEVSTSLSQDIDLGSSIGNVAEGKIDQTSLNRPEKKKRKRLKLDEAGVIGEASSDEEEEDENADEDEPLSDKWDSDSGIRMSDGDEGHDKSSSDNRIHRMTEIKRHLQLLAEHPHHFVRAAGNRGLGEWRVDFRSLVHTLQQTELLNSIAARFGGPLAPRLVRVLLDKGKLDEKQIAHIAMLRQKEIRVTLTAMQEAGYVELQEVPRDNNRQPSRTMYFWYFDAERCRMLVLEESYKAMARALQRVREERRGVQAVIDKAERTDVVGKEDVYLAKGERAALQRWRDKEEKLLGAVGRLDALVGVLRDY